MGQMKAHTKKDTVVLMEKRTETMPLVSVVMPVYNVTPYLQACLDSVKGQSLQNIEIICINDGSTDNSLDILKENAASDSRITVLSQSNSGLSATRNVGVQYAEGTYIYFMDSDDILEKHALKMMYEAAFEDDLDIVYCDGSSFSDDPECHEQAEIYQEYYKRKQCYEGVRTGAALMKDMLSNEEYRVSACLQMMKREFFLTNALWFYEGILHEDNLFTFGGMLKALRVSHVNESLFSRRVRAGSIVTGNVTFARVYGYFCCYLKMEEILKNISIAAEEEKAAWEIVKRVLHNSRNLYIKLTDTEKEVSKALPQSEKMLFEFLVADVSNALLDVKEKNERLQKTYQEKSELNQKLQKTYQEKSELNQKLQKAYQEKSEINQKLKTTYEEKRERGEKIKELRAVIKEQSKDIVRLQGMVGSTTYKVGKIVMYIPYKVKAFLAAIVK